jgi:RNA polymerase sigma factor (sigma-70 family)
MGGSPFSDVVRYLRGLIGLRGGGDLSDAQLLQRFVTHRDPAAFETLVQRHGPMVLGVCRQLLRDPQDAEDAFQATFLVLARKAGAIAQRELVGNWLYGVAYRVAVRARARASRRQARERQGADMTATEAADDAGERELRPVLHEEVNRLPAKYRLPVVLCYLEGKTNAEAARELGWPTGTVSGRLARARDLLRRRLVRRGLTLSAAVAVLLARDATAVPPPLLAATVRAALLCLAGPAAAGLIPAQVTSLVKGVLQAMFMTKVKKALVVLLVALLITGAGLLALRAPAEPPQPPGAAPAGPPAAAETPQPGPAAKERATLTGHGGMVWAVAFSPDGKTLATVSGLYDKPGELILWDAVTGKEKARAREPKGIRSVAFSPDGKLIATADYYDNHVRLRDPETGTVRTVLDQGSPNNAVAFSPDGKLLAVGLLQDKSVKLWDVAGGREVRTLRGHTDWVPHVAFSPDGRLLASGGRDKTVRLWDVQTGQEYATLSGHEGTVECVAWSPDGKTLASASWDCTVKLWEVSTGKERATLKGHKLQVLYVAFTPDGKTLATTSGEADSPITDVNEKPGEIKLWDALTGKEYAALHGHNFRVWSVIFSADGKTMVTSAEDKTVKLWDLAPRPRQPAGELTAQDLAGLWDDLASDDAARAYTAVGKLTAVPDQAVALLRQRLQPAPAGDAAQQKKVAQLVAQLDDNDFAVREKASEELEKLGAVAEPELRKALEGEPSVEVRRRAERLLEMLKRPVLSAETVRGLRAVEVLEQVGGAGARQALEAIAKGAPEAPLTRDAKRALQRLAGRR